jgi:fructose-1,6-bisphosphatase
MFGVLERVEDEIAKDTYKIQFVGTTMNHDIITLDQSGFVINIKYVFGNPRKRPDQLTEEERDIIDKVTEGFIKGEKTYPEFMEVIMTSLI